MNLFEYTLTMKEIETATTKKAIDALARKIQPGLLDLARGDGNRYYYGSNVYFDNSKHILGTPLMDSITRAYRCLSYASSKYDGAKPLIQVIGDTLRNVSHMYISAVHVRPDTYTYEQFLHFFEFTPRIVMSSIGEDQLINFIKLIGDNEITDKLHYSVSVPYVLRELTRNNGRVAEVLYVQSVKDSLPTDKTYTFAEKILDDAIRNITPETNFIKEREFAHNILEAADKLDTILADRKASSGPN